jgi:hypothetical protein
MDPRASYWIGMGLPCDYRKQHVVKEKVVAEQNGPKQTGPSYRVKDAVRLVMAGAALALAALTLAGCSTDHWHRTDKTPAETAADYKACNDRAEEITLTRAGQQRASYTARAAARPPNGLPTGTGANVGETPMQMHDRVATESTFDRDLRTCMTDKGYTLAP